MADDRLSSARAEAPAQPRSRETWGVSQLKVNVSASPAWEAELEGGVNVFLPSARALKCCEERGEGTQSIWYTGCYI